MPILPMNEEILPPSDDYIFKAILTHPDAKPALISLASAVIGREVTDVQIRNNELPTMDSEEKNERLDLNCVVDDGDQIDLEMHGSRLQELSEGHKSFLNKYVFYLTDLHSSQKAKGIGYSEFVRTYQVTFCTYTVFPNWPDYFSSASMRRSNGEEISDQINMIVIELNKLDKVLKKTVDKMTVLERWSTFLGYAADPKQRELVNEVIKHEEAIGMAGAVLAAISKDEHERAKFRSRRMAETDRISDLITATERGRTEGKKEGRIEGKLEGVMETARKFKLEGIPVDTIARVTGLSVDEVVKL